MTFGSVEERREGTAEERTRRFCQDWKNKEGK